MVQHIYNLHRGAGGVNQQDAQQVREEHFVKRYISYCKNRCFPRLTPSASTMLKDEYARIRREAQEQIESGNDAVPITVRQLEALIRISESLARM